MRCPRCRAELAHISADGTALKVRTRLAVFRAGALAFVCPSCRSDVPVGAVDAATAERLATETLAAAQRATDRRPA